MLRNRDLKSPKSLKYGPFLPTITIRLRNRDPNRPKSLRYGPFLPFSGKKGPYFRDLGLFGSLIIILQTLALFSPF